MPPLARRVVTGLADQIGALQIQLTRLEKELLAWHRDSDLSQRLATIPGVGIVSATALAASVSEPERFRSGRQFAASLGLTPLQNCSGGKERLGRISRMGDRYLRRLLVVGMTSRGAGDLGAHGWGVRAWGWMASVSAPSWQNRGAHRRTATYGL